MKITTEQAIKILYILSWIIFVGVCVEAGGFIFNGFFTLLLNPVGARHFWKEVDLTALYQYGAGYFFIESLTISIVAVLRGYLFYHIVKVLHDKKLDMSRPFSAEFGGFILRIAYITLFIGLFSWWGVKYTAWLVQQGVKMPGIQYLRIAGDDVWLFMSVTLFVIAQIFKRGIEIQTENELTV